MTQETLDSLIATTRKQLPRKELFQDGTLWSTFVESETWKKKGVDEELIADKKTITCLYEIQDGEWVMKAINDVPVEECII